jgi:mannan endo-1,4-beta-mannosidase
MTSWRTRCLVLVALLLPGLACAVPTSPAAAPDAAPASAGSAPAPVPDATTSSGTDPALSTSASRSRGFSPLPTTSPFVQRNGTQLLLHGKPYRVVGVNAYELATQWGVNPGCGAMLDDAALDAFFTSLPPGSMVRVWGFQGSMGTNIHTHARDWGPLDRVVQAASRHGDRLLVSLGNQAGDCDDGHWKDSAWYRGGYRNLYPGDGYTIATTSYWDWVHEVVSRYKSSPAIAMWEPINEPEATECDAGSQCVPPHLHCPDQQAAAAALRSFFDVVGREIKRIDPNHLVESGALGGPQCGWADDLYQTVDASPGIDVASYHDYESAVLSPFLKLRLQQMARLGKPLIVGELGVVAGGNGAGGCATLAARRDAVDAKVRAQFDAGAASALMWDWVPDARPAMCTYDIGTSDPLNTLLRTEGG